MAIRFRMTLPAMNWKKLRYYVYGSVVMIVVFFSAVELVTRTISWATGRGFTLALHQLEPYDAGVMNIYQWHPFTGITFKPNRMFEAGHGRQKEVVWVKVDKHGFLAKDQTLSYQKANNEIRIATVGGSTTANINLEFEENWPGKLGSLIQQALPSKKITVTNAGVPGFDTAQSIANLALRVMPFNPDIVIIYHAYNDLKAIRTDIPFSPDYSHIHRIPFGYHEEPIFLIRWLNKSMFYVILRNKYRDLKKLGTHNDASLQKRGLSSIPLDAERAFEQHVRLLIGIARSGGAKVVLSSFATLHDPAKDHSKHQVVDRLSALQKNELYALSHFNRGLTLNGVFGGIARYNAIIKTVAEGEKTGWVDNANEIPHQDEYFLDRVHFSKKGAARMAENLLPVVLERLGQ